MNLLLGHEWWVSEEWGIGAALEGQCSFGSTDRGAEHQSCFGNLLFSATYN